MDGEMWRVIPEFPNYEVSNLGNIYNRRNGYPMRTSLTQFGHVKITLVDESGGEVFIDDEGFEYETPRRYTRSVARLVAEEFCTPPNELCDHIVILDGDFSNVCADNLVWRPRGFAWSYTHQLKTRQPIYYRNLPVINLLNGEEYENIIEAGMKEGLLFHDIWRSTYSGAAIFPHGSIFEVIGERV